ncbi:MAG: AI-2E family transporter [Desulfobulbus sp.]|jgi:predicted PurR-regulated permease PerM|uniref:AI-2E family transporter n=1 Tax=Desulfobulbus sp. TaxID=895 RepID=UPI0028517215|nr:AI-2E family transporter [Desulfobulbus sp.]MDR2550515.1 AI-2E family transporter [Desulfobulbus sp.]
MNHEDNPFRFLPQPWDRIFPHVATVVVWGMFFGVIYLLRSFFLLLFLTFVFSYIQARSVSRLEPHIKNRIVRVVLVALLFLSILTAAGIFLVPKVKKQTELFASQFTTYLSRVDQELFSLSKRYPLLGELVPELASKQEQPPPEGGEKKGLKHSPTALMLQQLLRLGDPGGTQSTGGGTQGVGSGVQNVGHVIGTLGNIGGKIAATTSAFLLSLLFSFLIVLDLPKLGASVRALESTKLRFIYRSVAGNIRDFSQVLGKALEAQLIIAIINSFLTAIGITLLGLGEQVAFLSVIVFFCSFFPVIGVFISSIPICLIALQTEGLQIMLLAILLICIIHLIEGYILNPRIYGSYMRINSVIILIILTIGGKLFDFWGLILGVPICTYVFGHAIRIKEKSEPEPLPPVTGD